MEFIDAHCLEAEKFRVSNSGRFFEEYQSLVKTMLNNLAGDLNIPLKLLVSTILSAVKEPFYYVCFESVRASYDIETFVEILNRRNRELTNEALELMDNEERETLTCKNIENLEEDKFELELALKNSMITKQSEENYLKELEEKEAQDIIKALQISAEEFIGGEQNELNNLLRIKNELSDKLKGSLSQKMQLMTEQERNDYEKAKAELQTWKQEVNRDVKNNKRLGRREKKLEEVNKQLENELRLLEEECQQLGNAIRLEEQRFENLNKKIEEPEKVEKIETSEIQSPGLNKVQLKKIPDFSIQELLPQPGTELTPVPVIKSREQSEKDRALEELNAKKARYRKMKEMIQSRKNPSNLSPSHDLIEKSPLPPLLPISNPSDLVKKQNFLKDLE